MGPEDELVERVRAFVAVKTGYPLGKVSPEAALARDIGLAGDDAVMFFEEFGVPQRRSRPSISRTISATRVLGSDRAVCCR